MHTQKLQENLVQTTKLVSIFGSKHTKMNQHDYFVKGLWVIFWSFSFLHRKEFSNKIFCNLLLKIFIISPIHHTFCINLRWIIMNFVKCTNFARFYISLWKMIIFWIHESFQYMSITLGFNFWNHKLQLFFYMPCALNFIYMW